MKIKSCLAILAAVGFTLGAFSVQAQQHRAVRLGHPTTRFAPPLTTPEELRALFASEKLKPDVAAILQQAGWKGSLDDLTRAAASAPIQEVALPTGTRMPFMSSRKDGQPIALMDVLWAGDGPIHAYRFLFSSKGRRYECLTPKPCSNFYVVDIGPARPDLAITCDAPDQALAGQRFEVGLAVTNKGTASATRVITALRLPEGIRVLNASESATNENGILRWTFPAIPPETAQKCTATLVSPEPQTVDFAWQAQGSSGAVVSTHCATEIAGIPAILLETRDLEDPIEVGGQVIYEIKVTNQGTANGTNLKVVCALPESEEYVSGSGPTPITAQPGSLTMAPLPTLLPKAQAIWSITVKALKPDDARFKVFIQSDQFVKPIQKDEATHLY